CQFVRALLTETPFNHATVIDAPIDDGIRIDAEIQISSRFEVLSRFAEDNGHVAANILLREWPETVCCFRRKRKVHLPGAGIGGVARFHCATQVAAGNNWCAVQYIPSFSRIRSTGPSAAVRARW